MRWRYSTHSRYHSGFGWSNQQQHHHPRVVLSLHYVAYATIYLLPLLLLLSSASCKQCHPVIEKVYVVGEVGIQEELDLIGVNHFGGPEDGDKVPDMGPGCKVDHDPDVGAVVVGFDRYVNYYKIQYAQLCINENPGCEFIATNTDAVTHLTDAQEWAGNGSMVGAIKGCTGREPTVVGKPSPLMIDYLCDKLGLDRGRICMVGDRLDTDILFGTDNGLKSLLVLSGVTTEEKLLSQENTITPDYYADSIVDFFIDEKAKVEA